MPISILRFFQVLKKWNRSIHEARGTSRDGPAIFLSLACCSISKSPLDLLDT